MIHLSRCHLTPAFMGKSQLMFASRPLPRHSGERLRVVVSGENPLHRAALVVRLSAFIDLAPVEDDGDAELRADVIVCDAMPDAASAPVLCLVGDGTAAAEAIARGASGVVLRNSAPRRLHDAICALAEGMLVVDDEVADRVLRQPRARVDLFEPLTPRELQVAQLLGGGLTNKEIAQRLGVTEHTVKFHLNGLLRKLGVSTRTEAVVQAARLGLLIL